MLFFEVKLGSRTRDTCPKHMYCQHNHNHRKQQTAIVNAHCCQDSMLVLQNLVGLGWTSSQIALAIHPPCGKLLFCKSVKADGMRAGTYSLYMG